MEVILKIDAKRKIALVLDTYIKKNKSIYFNKIRIRKFKYNLEAQSTCYTMVQDNETGSV